MAARKLQTEIDRTLKKVSEGVELFDSIYDKMQASTNQTQKEKLELDLKSQIKKLQRLRDQIKTWVSSSEIKDKSALLENRKIIETQMEKFKACEKEMKTKAFSKDGLIAALKLDPKEKEKAEASAWLASQVDELSRQIEQSEAEVELLQAGGTKKKGKGGAQSSRLEELSSLNERRKWHIGRLEIILRLLENNSLETEKVLDLKEHISYFVESNTEEDFEEDDGIYDELNLDEQDAAFGRVGQDDDNDDSDSEVDGETKPAPQRSPAKETTKKSNRDDKRDDTHSPVLRKAVPVRKATLDSSKVPPPILPPAPNFAAQPMSQALKSGLPSSGAPGTAGSKPALPPIRYAAAVANSAPSTNGTSAASASSNGPSTNGPPASHAVNGSLALGAAPPTPATATPATSQAQSSAQHLGATEGKALTPSLSSAASVAAQENASVPPSPSMSSPMTSSAAPASSIQPQGSASAYFDSRQQSPILSNQVDQSVSATSPNVSTSVVSGSSYPANRSQPPTTATSVSQASPGAPSGSGSQVPSVPHVAAPSPLPQQVQYSQQQQAGAQPANTHGVQQQQKYQNALDVPSSTSSGSSPMPTQTTHQQQHPPYPPGVLPAPLAQQSQQQPQIQHSSHSQQQQQHASSRPAGLPSSLADLVASFESAKQKAPTRMGNLNQVHKVLEAGFNGIPQPRDTEKPKYYVPRNPYATPAYYPQQPLTSFENPAMYGRFDPETLFYIFYFHAGTYQQYLAAQELKRQSWRFHTKYLTWFQRHSEPQAITDEYEQGVYVYFDWEGSWCQRKKSDFRFEYRYLSED